MGGRGHAHAPLPFAVLLAGIGAPRLRRVDERIRVDKVVLPVPVLGAVKVVLVAHGLALVRLHALLLHYLVVLQLLQLVVV